MAAGMLRPRRERPRRPSVAAPDRASITPASASATSKNTSARRAPKPWSEQATTAALGGIAASSSATARSSATRQSRAPARIRSAPADVVERVAGHEVLPPRDGRGDPAARTRRRTDPTLRSRPAGPPRGHALRSWRGAVRAWPGRPAPSSRTATSTTYPTGLQPGGDIGRRGVGHRRAGPACRSPSRRRPVGAGG